MTTLRLFEPPPLGKGGLFPVNHLTVLDVVGQRHKIGGSGKGRILQEVRVARFQRRVILIELQRLFEVGTLTFEKPDYENFDCLNIAFESIKRGGTAPTVMNAANEIAVAKFLNDEICFLDIPLILFFLFEFLLFFYLLN